MQFTKLRLSGFKSFVEPTELAIEPGLTGIVGPNGCGKSNLVEALRWVMGETSAKRMRGGEMDDVIFGGTALRPARNVAEVGLLLDNAARQAPAHLNDSEELEVVRRIERGSGSLYRVNAREVRARDVQLLFADAATGAHSTALVSQGRIGALIAAKPAERRALLEEAAGITGLHSRRHEAELRLKAAETNLTRLEDVVRTLTAQLDSLKKQARQAGRYRRLADHIRRAEAILLHLKWRAAEEASAEAAARLREAERLVGALTADSLAAERARETAAEALPALRHDEAAAAAELQRLVLARQALDEEERRIAAQQEEGQRRLDDLAHDMQREEERAHDAARALAALADERQRLTAEQSGEAAAEVLAAEALQAAEAALAAAEAELAERTQAVAAEEARREQLNRRSAELAERRHRLAQRIAEAERQREDVAREIPEDGVLAEARQALAAAEAEIERTRSAAEAAEAALAAARAEEAAARQPLQEAEGRRNRLAAEAAALADLLAAGESKEHPPVLDVIGVAPGYETALGAALGDDLVAALAEEAPTHWSTLAPFADPPPLPFGAEPLAQYVSAPPALARRLSQVGVVADPAAARVLRDQLRPGQRLVTRDGGLWRWDGFTVAAGTPTAPAMRLKQRNRLAELEGARAEADADVARLAEALAAAAETARIAADDERAARQGVRDAFAAQARTRESEAVLARTAAAGASRLTALAESLAQLNQEMIDAGAEADAAARDLAALPDPAVGRDALAELRARLAGERGKAATLKADYDRLQREAFARRERLKAIAGEETGWQARAEAAAQQRRNLETRRQEVAELLTRLAGRPAEIAAQRESLVGSIETATARRSAAGDALAVGERTLAEAEKTLRAAQAALGEARESRVRCEAAVSQAEQTKDAIKARIAERLSCQPEETLTVADIAAGETLPPVDEVEARLERLVRERDGMGPVNLVAEAEAAELEERMKGLETERADLVAAIAKLRQGIAALNREGRERLVEAFKTVNEHFESLFVRLFGGGVASPPR